MARRSGKYWKADIPTARELKKLSKAQKKAQKNLEVLRKKEALHSKIQKQTKEIKALRQKQSRIGRTISRAEKEWKQSATERKSVGKALAKLNKTARSLRWDD